MWQNDVLHVVDVLVERHRAIYGDGQGTNGFIDLHPPSSTVSQVLSHIETTFQLLSPHLWMQEFKYAIRSILTGSRKFKMVAVTP
jgi:hypothetical protein